MVTIRNFCPGDILAYVRLVNKIDKVDEQGKVTSVAQVKERLERPGFCLEDLLFAEVDGLLVGYVEMVRELEIGRVILDGAVHPEYRNRGVGSQILEAAIERSCELGVRVVQIPVAEEALSGEHCVRKKGFRVVRHHWKMQLIEYRRRLPRVPPGFRIDYLVCGDEESLCRLQNLAFAGSWGFCPNTVDEIRYLLNTSCCQPEGVLFICQDEKKVGYCWTMDDPVEKEKGYIRMLGVHPLYRQRGLSSVILAATIEHLIKRGIKEIQLSVDSRNTGAVHLYQSLGFRRKSTTIWYQKRLPLD